MGVSTQRLLMVVIAINLVLSLSYAIYETPRTIDYGLFGETIDLGGNTATSVEGEGSSVAPESLQEEGSFTNALRMGSIIFTLFVRGMIALPFNTAGLGSGLEKMIVFGLLLFKSLMYMLLVIEIYMLFKNKKSS